MDATTPAAGAGAGAGTVPAGLTAAGKTATTAGKSRSSKSHTARFAVMQRRFKQAARRAGEDRAVRSARLAAENAAEPGVRAEATRSGVRALLGMLAARAPDPAPGSDSTSAASSDGEACVPPGSADGGLSEPRSTPLSATVTAPGHLVGDQVWSRVVSWVDPDGVREKRVAVVVSDVDVGNMTVWVLWQDHMYQAALSALYPFKTCGYTRAAEWLAVSCVAHASVCLPTEAGAVTPDASKATHTTKLVPTQCYQTVPLHANDGVFLSPDVHQSVLDFYNAANEVSRLAQHLFATFVRLLLSSYGHSPFAVPGNVQARLRTWHRRCYSLCNPSSKLYSMTLEQVLGSGCEDDTEEVEVGTEEEVEEEIEEGVEEEAEEAVQQPCATPGDGAPPAPAAPTSAQSAATAPIRLPREVAAAIDAPVWPVLFAARQLPC